MAACMESSTSIDRRGFGILVGTERFQQTAGGVVGAANAVQNEKTIQFDGCRRHRFIGQKPNNA